MKCVRKRSTAEQFETCGIWLDTAKLKKRKIQTLISKPTSNMPNPLLERNYNSHISVNFTQTRLSQAYTRQTTISSFFSIQPTGQKIHLVSLQGIFRGQRQRMPLLVCR
ncbi:aurora kinase A and ninein-interacting protein [Gopherus evgoodei]|uniref:aurora kinase A and ninein-interacting protein n=1 Tax=Gopherus evgoodei TaxID=1825980 RepID=UPI0011CF9835|nr:aurora kinase A and ninein-interacting protein [Gopherus evgoodei]